MVHLDVRKKEDVDSEQEEKPQRRRTVEKKNGEDHAHEKTPTTDGSLNGEPSQQDEGGRS